MRVGHSFGSSLEENGSAGACYAAVVARYGTLALLCLALGCGSASEADPNLCTPEYDPLGMFCDMSIDKMGMRAAEEIVRSEVPEDALLFSVRSSPHGLLDPDGRADQWYFRFYMPGGADFPDATFQSIMVYSAGTWSWDPYTSTRALICEPAVSLPVLDSRALVHDTIRTLERDGDKVSLGDGGNLRIEMTHPCASEQLPLGFVEYRDKAVDFDETGKPVGIRQVGSH